MLHRARVDGLEAALIPRFDRPGLLVWGEWCQFFPTTDAQRLASDLPCATLVPVPHANTWIRIDNSDAVTHATDKFVPGPEP